jgi:acyl-CoA thioesterase-1
MVQRTDAFPVGAVTVRGARAVFTSLRFGAGVRALRWLLLVAALAVSPGAAGAAPVILVLGDSLSAGYGLAQGQRWVTLLQKKLDAERYGYTIVNASISGDTTAGGRSRLDALLREQRPAITIVELGANDGLRGGSLDAMRANLEAIIAAAQKAGSRVLLVGMRLPPNYGSAYGERFHGVYEEVAKAQKVALVPFLMEGFAEDTTLFQPDRVHPLAAAQARMLDNVWPKLKPLLSAVKP